MAESAANQVVRAFWEQEPCGTGQAITEGLEEGTGPWFERIEQYRYALEPFIHSVAQFTRFHGKKVLEVGVGAGTDHLQWARAGAQCYGVDLTQAAIDTTRRHLAHHGFQSDLRRVDAESLPFPDETFDAVYSWGVIHHSASPERIIAEIKRVLKPGGVFIGMMYGRRSLWVLKYWIKHALLKGRPWRTFRDVVASHIESRGTKAYTVRELRRLFSGFSGFSARPILTPYDVSSLPQWLGAVLPDSLGWFIALHAKKP